MKEESIEFETDRLFYNPNMQFCRSFFSLAVGAINKDIALLDGFTASGIRGIRYAKENKNVKQIDFLEANDEAIPIIKKNLAKNKIKGKTIESLYEKHFSNGFLFYDLIEIDPFGTPVPYLWSTFYGQHKKKEFYLSVTATDVAVLCGPQAKACLKNYHSKSLNNEFTHENGTRILIKRVMESANEFDFGITPILSLSDRHYIKILLKLEKNADKAYDNGSKIGYTSYCNKCGWRSSAKRMKNICELCKSQTDYAGPVWLGELHDKKIINEMLKLNKKRNYQHKEEIEKTLSYILGEINMPPCFYDVHKECKRVKAKTVPKIEEVLKKLNKLGFKASRTHFASTGVRSDAGIKDIHKILKIKT